MTKPIYLLPPVPGLVESPVTPSKPESTSTVYTQLITPSFTDTTNISVFKWESDLVVDLLNGFGGNNDVYRHTLYLSVDYMHAAPVTAGNTKVWQFTLQLSGFDPAAGDVSYFFPYISGSNTNPPREGGVICTPDVSSKLTNLKFDMRLASPEDPSRYPVASGTLRLMLVFISGSKLI